MLCELCSQTTAAYLVITSSCWRLDRDPANEAEAEVKSGKGRERERERRKVEEANGRGAATGVLVHGLVTQER